MVQEGSYLRPPHTGRGGKMATLPFILAASYLLISTPPTTATPQLPQLPQCSSPRGPGYDYADATSPLYQTLTVSNTPKANDCCAACCV